MTTNQTRVFEGERALHRGARRAYLQGEITPDGEQILVEDLDLILDAAASVAEEGDWSPVQLYISSPGGDTGSGLELIRAIQNLQEFGLPVHGIVRGYAMSMAFLILQYCEVRWMHRGDILMAHGVTFDLHRSDKANVEAERQMIEDIDAYFIDNLVRRTRIPQDQWADLHKRNTPVYYTADQALEHGLIDVVFEDSGQRGERQHTYRRSYVK